MNLCLVPLRGQTSLDYQKGRVYTYQRISLLGRHLVPPEPDTPHVMVVGYVTFRNTQDAVIPMFLSLTQLCKLLCGSNFFYTMNEFPKEVGRSHETLFTFLGQF